MTSSLAMLTSGVSQYLHPEYLQPLPATLDAKNSPLALLAQTCSAIGKEPSPTKPIIPPLEKKDSDRDSDPFSKRPSSHGNKDTGKDSKPGFRTFQSKELPISGPSIDKSLKGSNSEPKPASSPDHHLSSASLSASSKTAAEGGALNSQRSSSRGSSGKSDVGGGDIHHHGGGHNRSHPHHRHRESPASSNSSSSTSTSSSPPYPKTLSSFSSSVMQSSSSMGPSPKSPTTHPSLLSSLSGSSHLSGYANPLSLMSQGVDPTNPAYHSVLAAHSSLTSFAMAAAQSTALKSAAAGLPTALSPFVTYARVRTPSGATTLVPVCRDPYCTNCQLTLQNSHLSSACNAPGCAQCAHEKSLTSLSILGIPGASMLLPSLASTGSLSGSMSALSSLHSLYSHSALAAAHQGLPYVCSWVSGSDFCGKRYSSSEELLQHLRTHTSSIDTLAASSYTGLGLSSLAPYPHLSAPPLSPNSLRRTYPTSISPVSSLLGTSRYHPYKSPLPGIGGAHSAPQPITPRGAYYPAYTLYGQRLGATVTP